MIEDLFQGTLQINMKMKGDISEIGTTRSLIGRLSLGAFPGAEKLALQIQEGSLGAATVVRSTNQEQGRDWLLLASVVSLLLASWEQDIRMAATKLIKLMTRILIGGAKSADDALIANVTLKRMKMR